MWKLLKMLLEIFNWQIYILCANCSFTFHARKYFMNVYEIKCQYCCSIYQDLTQCSFITFFSHYPDFLRSILPLSHSLILAIWPRWPWQGALRDAMSRSCMWWRIVTSCPEVVCGGESWRHVQKLYVVANRDVMSRSCMWWRIVTSCPEVVCGGEYAESIGPSPPFKVICVFVCVDGHCGGGAGKMCI